MRGLAALLAGALRTSIGVIPGMRLLDRFAGLAARARRRCLPVLGDRCGSALSPRRDRAAPLGAALGDPLRDQRGRAAGAPARGARAGRPDRRVPRAARDRRAARQRARKGSGRRPSVEERRPRHGDRVRSRRRGLRLGRPPRARRDERARRRRDRDGRASTRRPGRRSSRRSSPSTPPTISRCSASRGSASRALALVSPDRGTPVALVGYPQNGPLTRTPGRLGGTANVLSRDAYGRGPVRRQMTTIRGAVEPGSSGGPGSRRAGASADDRLRAAAAGDRRLRDSGRPRPQGARAGGHAAGRARPELHASP